MGGLDDPIRGITPEPGSLNKAQERQYGPRDVELVAEPAIVHAEVLGKDETTGRLIVKIEEQKGSFFRGPLPPPEVLREYEEISPGSAALLFQEFTKQGDHRRRWETTAISASIEDTRRGQRHALVVSVLMILGACFCAYIGQPWVGAALVGTSAFGIIAAFIHGRQRSATLPQPLSKSDKPKRARDLQDAEAGSAELE